MVNAYVFQSSKGTTWFTVLDYFEPLWSTFYWYTTQTTCYIKEEDYTT